MPLGAKIKRGFFDRSVHKVAPELIGVLLLAGGTGGVIVEVEAYHHTDPAAHSYGGQTPRNAVMYGKPGLAYVYFTYGMHWMLNVVSEAEDFPAAVLIRALEPLEGLELMQQHRPVPHSIELCRGPAKLTQALRIDRTLNGVDLCNRQGELWIEAGEPVPTRSVGRGPRVGLGTTPEPWKSKPWRYWIKHNQGVSK